MLLQDTLASEQSGSGIPHTSGRQGQRPNSCNMADGRSSLQHQPSPSMQAPVDLTVDYPREALDIRRASQASPKDASAYMHAASAETASIEDPDASCLADLPEGGTKGSGTKHDALADPDSAWLHPTRPDGHVSLGAGATADPKAGIPKQPGVQQSSAEITNVMLTGPTMEVPFP